METSEPHRRRRGVCVLPHRFRVSQRRACRLAGHNRNTQLQPVPVTGIEEQKLSRRIGEAGPASCAIAGGTAGGAAGGASARGRDSGPTARC